MQEISAALRWQVSNEGEFYSHICRWHGLVVLLKCDLVMDECETAFAQFIEMLSNVESLQVRLPPVLLCLIDLPQSLLLYVQVVVVSRRKLVMHMPCIHYFLCEPLGRLARATLLIYYAGEALPRAMRSNPRLLSNHELMGTPSSSCVATAHTRTHAQNHTNTYAHTRAHMADVVGTSPLAIQLSGQRMAEESVSFDQFASEDAHGHPQKMDVGVAPLQGIAC
jgi:hypothetical protein